MEMINFEYHNFKLGFSSETGALVLLTREDSPYENFILAEGDADPEILSLDIKIDDLWLGKNFAPSLKRVSSELIESRGGDAKRIILEVTLGNVKILEIYSIEKDLISRKVIISSDGSERLKITGLRFIIPRLYLGNPYESFLVSPGSAIRPDYSVARAINKAIQVENGENLLDEEISTVVISDDFPVSKDRFGFVVETSPDSSPGILAVTNRASKWSLLSWYVSELENALPGFKGSTISKDNISLVHTVNVAGWLEGNGTFEVGTQYILLTGDGWAKALSLYRSFYPLTGIYPPVYGDSPEWIKSATIYEVHPGMFGGFKGLKNHLKQIQELGFNTLYILPVWLYDNLTDLPWDENWKKSGSPYAIRDFELFDPSLGNEEDFRELIAEAHRLGIKVLLDFVSQGCSKSARYINEKPEWFVRDEDGNMVSSHGWYDTYSFDWSNEEYHEYMLKWSLTLLKRFGFDGYRVDAPVGKEPNWDTNLGYRASKTNLGVVPLLEKLRLGIKDISNEAVLLCEVPGPIFMRSHDILCDYLPLSWTVKLLFGEVGVEEWGAWMKDYWLSLPEGAKRVSFTETHDTRSLAPPSYGLRGSAFEMAGFAALVLAGFIPMVWAGQEVGNEEFYKKLFAARSNCRTLIEGKSFFNAVGCSNRNVLSIVKVGEEISVWGLISLNPEKQSFLFDLPLSKFSIQPDKNYRLYDLIEKEFWSEYGKEIWKGKECKKLELSPLPYKPYFFIFKELE